MTGRGQASDWEKPERLVFGFIHKLNFLFPIGPVGLKLVVSAFAIALIGLMAVVGLRMDIIRKLRTRRHGRRLSEGRIAAHLDEWGGAASQSARPPFAPALSEWQLPEHFVNGRFFAIVAICPFTHTGDRAVAFGALSLASSSNRISHLVHADRDRALPFSRFAPSTRLSRVIAM